jgi:hypothetical protein
VLVHHRLDVVQRNRSCSGRLTADLSFPQFDQGRPLPSGRLNSRQQPSPRRWPAAPRPAGRNGGAPARLVWRLHCLCASICAPAGTAQAGRRKPYVSTPSPRHVWSRSLRTWRHSSRPFALKDVRRTSGRSSYAGIVPAAPGPLGRSSTTAPTWESRGDCTLLPVVVFEMWRAHQQLFPRRTCAGVTNGRTGLRPTCSVLVVLRWERSSSCHVEVTVLEGLEVTRPTLEDVYLSLTAEAPDTPGLRDR